MKENIKNTQMSSLENIKFSSSDLIRRSRENKALDSDGFPLSLRSAGMTGKEKWTGMTGESEGSDKILRDKSLRMTGKEKWAGMTRKWGLTITGTLILLTLGFATPSGAATCAGGAGIVVTGLDNVNYCLSSVGNNRTTMNWWSAVAWCDAIGMELISVDDCNGVNRDITGTACPNFGSNPYYWTSTSTADPTRVYYKASNVLSNTPKISSQSALCKPKSNNN